MTKQIRNNPLKQTLAFNKLNNERQIPALDKTLNYRVLDSQQPNFQFTMRRAKFYEQFLSKSNPQVEGGVWVLDTSNQEIPILNSKLSDVLPHVNSINNNNGEIGYSPYKTQMESSKYSNKYDLLHTFFKKMSRMYVAVASEEFTKSTGATILLPISSNFSFIKENNAVLFFDTHPKKQKKSTQKYDASINSANVPNSLSLDQQNRKKFDANTANTRIVPYILQSMIKGFEIDMVGGSDNFKEKLNTYSTIKQKIWTEHENYQQNGYLTQPQKDYAAFRLGAKNINTTSLPTFEAFLKIHIPYEDLYESMYQRLGTLIPRNSEISFLSEQEDVYVNVYFKINTNNYGNVVPNPSIRFDHSNNCYVFKINNAKAENIFSNHIQNISGGTINMSGEVSIPDTLLNGIGLRRDTIEHTDVSIGEIILLKSDTSLPTKYKVPHRATTITGPSQLIEIKNLNYSVSQNQRSTFPNTSAILEIGYTNDHGGGADMGLRNTRYKKNNPLIDSLPSSIDSQASSHTHPNKKPLESNLSFVYAQMFYLPIHYFLALNENISEPNNYRQWANTVSRFDFNRLSNWQQFLIDSILPKDPTKYIENALDDIATLPNLTNRIVDTSNISPFERITESAYTRNKNIEFVYSELYTTFTNIFRSWFDLPRHFAFDLSKLIMVKTEATPSTRNQISFVKNNTHIKANPQNTYAIGSIIIQCPANILRIHDSFISQFNQQKDDFAKSLFEILFDHFFSASVDKLYNGAITKVLETLISDVTTYDKTLQNYSKNYISNVADLLDLSHSLHTDFLDFCYANSFSIFANTFTKNADANKIIEANLNCSKQPHLIPNLTLRYEEIRKLFLFVLASVYDDLVVDLQHHQKSKILVGDATYDTTKKKYTFQISQKLELDGILDFVEITSFLSSCVYPQNLYSHSKQVIIPSKMRFNPLVMGELDEDFRLLNVSSFTLVPNFVSPNTLSVSSHTLSRWNFWKKYGPITNRENLKTLGMYSFLGSGEFILPDLTTGSVPYAQPNKNRYFRAKDISSTTFNFPRTLTSADDNQHESIGNENVRIQERLYVFIGNSDFASRTNEFYFAPIVTETELTFDLGQIINKDIDVKARNYQYALKIYDPNNPLRNAHYFDLVSDPSWKNHLAEIYKNGIVECLYVDFSRMITTLGSMQIIHKNVKGATTHIDFENPLLNGDIDTQLFKDLITLLNKDVFATLGRSIVKQIFRPKHYAPKLTFDVNSNLLKVDIGTHLLSMLGVHQNVSNKDYVIEFFDFASVNEEYAYLVSTHLCTESMYHLIRHYIMDPLKQIIEDVPILYEIEEDFEDPIFIDAVMDEYFANLEDNKAQLQTLLSQPQTNKKPKVNITRNEISAIFDYLTLFFNLPLLNNRATNIVKTDLKDQILMGIKNPQNYTLGMMFDIIDSNLWALLASGTHKDNLEDVKMFAGGNDVNALAWHNKNSDSLQDVGGKKPNLFGLYDMSGNASEYVDIPDSKTAFGKMGGSYLDHPDTLRLLNLNIAPPYSSWVVQTKHQAERDSSEYNDMSFRFYIKYKIVKK